MDLKKELIFASNNKSGSMMIRRCVDMTFSIIPFTLTLLRNLKPSLISKG